MKSSQFDAKTYGAGELITQRKLFRVPSHQRSYAWEQDSVDTFLRDIAEAFERDASDYFIGLVVAQGPEDGDWILLDGQQRITTISLVYAAIRYWLAGNGFEADADQINNDYLAVRRLGGDFSSRLKMNLENQEAFSDVVVKLTPSESLRKLAKAASRPSNRLLYKAALTCREWIEGIAAAYEPDGVHALYEMARFVSARVKLVCVDVSTEADAYMIFESLNDRGVDLSALDLIKNHIAGKVPEIEHRWSILLDHLGDANPDDFLKVFWTSRYGLVQKSQLFRRVKETYPSASDAETLLEELLSDAETLSAIQDEDHPFWDHSLKGARDQIALLQLLGAKQTRPVVVAALRRLGRNDLEGLLWVLLVSVVRFQVVGKGRPAVMEYAFSKLCLAIAAGENRTSTLTEAIRELLIPNDVFQESFMRHYDRKFNRLAYLHAEMSLGVPKAGDDFGARASHVRKILESTTLDRLASPAAGQKLHDDWLFLSVANFTLHDEGQNIRETYHSIVNSSIDQTGNKLFEVTLMIRADVLAKVAVRVWTSEELWS